MATATIPRPEVTDRPIIEDPPRMPVEHQAELPSTPAPAPAEAPPINYRAIYVSSILAVSFLFFVGVGVPLSFELGLKGGLGLGAFTAFWGGPSFGVMTGSARVSARMERADADH